MSIRRLERGCYPKTGVKIALDAAERDDDRAELRRVSISLRLLEAARGPEPAPDGASSGSD
eukprot:3307416-Pyramimonas_sp.AAC.1